MVVGAPVGDAFLDGFGLEVLGEGFLDKGGDFLVGSETQSDELAGGELVDVGNLIGTEEGLETQALFKADDAVLKLIVIHSALGGEDEEGNREDDPPDDDVGMRGPVADGEPNSKGQVEDEDRKDEVVDDRVNAVMVL